MSPILLNEVGQRYCIAPQVQPGDSIEFHAASERIAGVVRMVRELSKSGLKFLIFDIEEINVRGEKPSFGKKTNMGTVVLLAEQNAEEER